MGQTERQTDARQLQPSVLSMQTVSVRRYVCNCAAHMLSQHGTAPPGVRVYNCTLCNYKCIDKNRFEEHEAMHTGRLLCDCYAPAVGGGALSDTAIRPSVPWRSCLGYGHAGCLQLSYHQRCADCGPNHGRMWIRHDFCHRQTAIGGEEAYRLAVPGAIPCWIN